MSLRFGRVISYKGADLCDLLLLYTNTKSYRKSNDAIGFEHESPSKVKVRQPSYSDLVDLDHVLL